MILLILLAVLAPNFSETRRLPADIERCHLSDPKFNDCFKEKFYKGCMKFVNGNKELGIPNFEPFYIEKLDVGQADPASKKLYQKYEKMYIYGTSNATLTKMDASFKDDDCRIHFEGTLPSVRLEADYTLSGKILLFNIDGHGKCRNIFENIEATHDIKCKKYMKKNKKYIEVTDYQFKMRPKKVTFDFQSAIPGHEKLNKEILDAVNADALAVYTDVQDGFDQSFAIIYKQIFNNVFSRVPEDELFLP